VLTQSVTLNHKIRQSGLLEIDHIFICLSALPAASWLQEVGFVCAESKLFQVDRGTLSQVIFFETMYLELIEVVDCQAAERFAIETGINFIDRCHWQWSGASPFGLALRPKLEENSSVRSRRVPNLFASQSIDELSLSFSSENLLTPADPLCFVVPSAVALPALIDCHSEQYRQKVSHPLGLERLTHTRIQGQKSILRSQPIQFLQEAGMLTIALGQSPLLELTFDHHQQNKVLDFQRFDLPLVLKF
jgi:hypothetical protein